MYYSGINKEFTRRFEVLAEKEAHLKLLVKRVNFALGRVATIGHCVGLNTVRVRAVLTAQQLAASGHEHESRKHAQGDASEGEPNANTEDLVAVLQAEVLHLTKEREFLMAKTKEDAGLLEQRTELARRCDRFHRIR